MQHDDAAAHGGSTSNALQCVAVFPTAPRDSDAAKGASLTSDDRVATTMRRACKQWFKYRVTGDGKVQCSAMCLLSVYPRIMISHGLHAMLVFDAEACKWVVDVAEDSVSTDSELETARMDPVQVSPPHDENAALVDAVLHHPYFDAAARAAGFTGALAQQHATPPILSDDELHVYTQCVNCVLRDLEIDTYRELSTLLLHRLQAVDATTNGGARADQ